MFIQKYSSFTSESSIMGQGISSAVTPPPLTLRNCLINGRFDVAKYRWYRRSRDLYKELEEDCTRSRKRKHSQVFEDINKKKKQTRIRSIKRHKLMVRDSDGSLREIRPTDTLWYLLYIAHPPITERIFKLFRLRFRMPYQSFLDLAENIRCNEKNSQWTRADAAGVSSHDIKLLLLGALRYIGRAWTLDDISEANGISIDTNRVFLMSFIQYGSTVLYQKWVINHYRFDTVHEQESIYRKAGFNGCIGSSDATHIAMLKCPQWASQNHKGFKLSVPARTYNVTGDHSRRILGSTFGHPGTWNDKTLVLFDKLICDVKNGIIPDNFEFKLFQKNEHNEIVEIVYKGVWFIVDNGYLAWSCTVPPDKHATSYESIRFSEWLESMRKDIECLFGIMKGRFCILRYGFRFHSIANCDKLWLTCCALHNLLLDIDGLDRNWDTTVQSEWEQYYNEHPGRNYDMQLETPFAIARLNNNLEEDMNYKETNDDLEKDISSIDYSKYSVDGKRIVQKMPLKLFRRLLIHHFDIRFKKHDIEWIRHVKQPNVI